MKNEFPPKISGKKYSKIKFHENPSHGSRVVQCEQTVRQIDNIWRDEVDIRFFAILRTRLKSWAKTMISFRWVWNRGSQIGPLIEGG